ncbi:WecB/TagA/CpsF family glycosyltransferase [bacterium]|nr:WecB/TagA/CpsF family glycosyltransferase [bacterium]
MNKIKILGYEIMDIDYKKLFQEIECLLQKKRFFYFVTLNPEIVVVAREAQELADYIKKAQMIFADGIGIVLGSKLLTGKAPQKITGIDLVEKLLHKQKYSFYLVGAKPHVMEKAAQKIKEKYPGSELKGYHHGSYDLKGEQAIIKDIKKTRPDFILVGLGFPNQDVFIRKLIKTLNQGIAIGIGGSLDIISGTKKRAPFLLRKIGVEWLYRTFKEPKRILRWYFLQSYVWLILKEWFKKLKITFYPQR